MKENHVKLLFTVEYDTDNVIKESIWAIKLTDKNYQIDNIPFYAYGFAYKDIVSVEEHSGQLWVTELVEASGNSTVRILFQNIEIVSEVREYFKKEGCDSEVSNIDSLIAIDIPNDISYKKIKDFLDNGELNGKWEYEESCISDKHQKDLEL